MTRLAPDETCKACGSQLVPTELASGMRIPEGVDYVCLNCGCAYLWTQENPPHLTLFVATERNQGGQTK
jgi:RNase P subunit RPR2